nr:MAG TPA: hypothetical protein [Caudoviricetes sp.]
MGLILSFNCFMSTPSPFLQSPKIEISLFYLLREVGLVVS